MEDLKSFIRQRKKKAKKIRGKHSPLSELVNKELKILKIENIYVLTEFNNVYLFIVKNYAKSPKKRYYLAISIVSQSSDFLVYFAKKFIKNNDNIRLVQYSLYPDTLRVNLIAMLEIKILKEYDTSINYLVELRKKYRKQLMSIIDKL